MQPCLASRRTSIVGDRLDREHLVEIAAHGFDAVEVFASRSHFDYHDGAPRIALAEWLDDTRLTLHSMHAPIARELRQRRVEGRAEPRRRRRIATPQGRGRGNAGDARRRRRRFRYRRWSCTRRARAAWPAPADNTATPRGAASRSCRRWRSARRAAGARGDSQRAVDADSAGRR